MKFRVQVLYALSLGKMKGECCDFLFRENFLKMAYFVDGMSLDNIWKLMVWHFIPPEIQALIVPENWRERLS